MLFENLKIDWHKEGAVAFLSSLNNHILHLSILVNYWRIAFSPRFEGD